MNNQADRREFERFPIEFMLEVFAEDAKGNEFNDKAVLENVSGGGAKFLTQNSDMYFPDQLLEITILFPGTDETEAHMKAKAIVVRVDPSNGSEKANKSRGLSIAVKFETRLNFARISV